MIYRVHVSPSTDIKINKSFLIGFLLYSDLKGFPGRSFGRP